MSTFTTLGPTQLGVGAKPFSTTVTALYENVLAIAEGDASAPKIKGAALDSSARSMVLLGTLTTTSGATQTLSGLALSTFNLLYITYSGVSCSATGPRRVRLGGVVISAVDDGAGVALAGVARIDLNSETMDGGGVNTIGGSSSLGPVSSPYNRLSTSIVFSWDGSGNFNNGSILVYGAR